MRSLPFAPLLVALSSAAPLYGQEPAVAPAQGVTTATPAPASSPPEVARPGAGQPAAPTPEQSAAPTTPAAPDTLAGHLELSAGGGLAVPFGRLEAGLPQSRRLGPGWALTLSASYGVSRSVALGLWGDMQRLSSGSDCGSCSGAGYAGGALAVYHLVQGVRFDPWLAAGVGWRTLTIESDSPDAVYSGPELIRILVGGDWYATSLLGLGPALELSAGTYTQRPAGAGSGRAFWQFQTTLRVALDLPGK